MVFVRNFDYTTYYICIRIAAKLHVLNYIELFIRKLIFYTPILEVHCYDFNV